jgi:hypothetical protein
MYTVERTDDEIDSLRNAVSEQIEKGRTRYHGLTYEQGIEDSIRWLLGETDEHPYPESE